MNRFRAILVTGGYGFIGSAFIRHVLKMSNSCDLLVNVDLLTYAADLKSLDAVAADSRYLFFQGNICDEAWIERLCIDYQIDAIVHFAAETHVDQSIRSPKLFFETNVAGTLSILEVIRRHPHIHLHHVSTDEVFGSLGMDGFFDERSPYAPNSPYSASKASADHFVRAYAHTYGLSTTLSYACNNYGPYQHIEKFIPLVIHRCLNKEPLPIYGNGKNRRSWLYVEDHAEALFTILQKATKGSCFAIGSEEEIDNLGLTYHIFDLFAHITGDQLHSLNALITFVPDRPGHDFRYALNHTKLTLELGWKPSHLLEEGLEKTILWYLDKSSGKMGVSSRESYVRI